MREDAVTSVVYGRWLYVMCGLPFSGKSTLARALAAFCGCELVVYDAINTERELGLDGALIPPHQ